MTNAPQTNTSMLRVIDIVTSDKDKKFAPYQDMANAIIAYVETHGRCEPEDLVKTGYFSHDEISRRWHMAYEMARIELKLVCRPRLANSSAAGQAIVKTLNNAIRAISAKGWRTVQS